uniref:NADP-dependent oxidoreductase domain-containing protein n=1 Tax=Sus scrofa TaxID=9823 RepID=A0A4X1T4Y2_PIG
MICLDSSCEIHFSCHVIALGSGLCPVLASDPWGNCAEGIFFASNFPPFHFPSLRKAGGPSPWTDPSCSSVMCDCCAVSTHPEDDADTRKKRKTCTSHGPLLGKEQQVMDPKSQRLRLNDGHFIPVLGFGTYAPEEPGEELLPTDENGKALFDTVDLCRTWEALEKCKDAGLTKSIGVSNFNHQQLERILNKPGLKYKPVCNQVECHPYLNQSKLLDFCKSKDIIPVAYSALGSQRVKGWVNLNHPVLLEDPVLHAIAKKHKQTSAVIALRYQLQRGVVVLAKSYNKKRIKENLQVFNFELLPEDMKTIDGLNQNLRYCDFSYAVGHPDYPF